MEYDTLRRLKGVNVPGLDRNYTYRDITETQTTSQIASLWYGDTKASAPYSYGYTYDTLGNIATYTENGTQYAYTYDPQGQLLTATGGSKTYAYTYDTVGNILTFTGKSGTLELTYGDAVWQDRLTKVDGETIYYDASGNPTSYYNDDRYYFQWENGRQLAYVNMYGDEIYYEYDLNGLRSQKTDYSGNVTRYYYAGDRLARETYGSNVLDFYYDQSGRPYALSYNGTVYYYILNLQGDGMALVDANGAEVASYTYTPYGEVITATGTMASINPLRYRGYYYDSDTGFYYLQSRYYDPMIGRFLNADGYMSTGQGILGNNMFAYCNNSPIFFKDSEGNRAEITVTCLNGDDGGGEAPEPNYIYDQEAEPYGSMSFGFSTIGKAGCGPVAAYNTLQTLGRTDISFQDVLALYDLPGGKNLWGYLGSMPGRAKFCLAFNGFSIEKKGTLECRMGECLGVDVCSSADAGIVWYWAQYDGSIYVHFVSFYRKDEKYYFLNVFKNSMEAYPFSGTILEFLDERGAFYSEIYLAYDK